MADKLSIEISEDLLEAIRTLAVEQGRPEGDLLEEALVEYLREAGLSDVVLRRGEETTRAWIGRSSTPSSETGQMPQPRGHGLSNEFQALLYRMSSRFDLDEDEAMSIALEEQKAFRRERSESERTGR